MRALDQVLVVADWVRSYCERLHTCPCHHHFDQAPLVNGLIRVCGFHRVNAVEKIT